MAGLRRTVRQRHVWLLAPFVALVAPLSRPLSDNSFLWHVRAGTVQLDLGEVLRTDPFSYTAQGEGWRTQSWLAELLYGGLERISGGVGWSMTLVLFCLLAAGLLVVLRSARRDVPVPILVGLGLLFVFQAFSFAVPRPVVLTYPLLAAVAIVVDDDDAELWVAPALIWLWASLHGSFPLGVGLLVLDALRRRNARRGGIAAVAALAGSLGAHGFAIWGILLDFLGSRETLGLIEEWSRPSLTDPRALPFFVVFGLLAVLAVARRVGWHDLFVAVPFALFGLTAARNMLPSLIVAGPVVAAGVAAHFARVGRGEPVRDELPLVNAALVAGLVAVLVFVAAAPRDFAADRFPSAEVVAALDDAKVVHDDAVGGYLIWAVGPDLKVFIDDRAELYGSDAFATMREILDGDLEALASSGATQALISRDEPLVTVLETAGWVERAGDQRFVLLETPD